MQGTDTDELIEQPDDILPGGDAGDGPGEDVVKHEGRDAELGKGAAERLLDDAIDTAAGEHGAALDVDRTDGEREEHDAENEPGGGASDGSLGDAAGIEGRGCQIVENDGRSAPEGDEGEHDRGGDDESDPVRDGSVRGLRCTHT